MTHNTQGVPEEAKRAILKACARQRNWEEIAYETARPFLETELRDHFYKAFRESVQREFWADPELQRASASATTWAAVDAALKRALDHIQDREGEGR